MIDPTSPLGDTLRRLQALARVTALTNHAFGRMYRNDARCGGDQGHDADLLDGCSHADCALVRAVPLGAAQERMFPIQRGPAIPWSVISPCEHQARRNHDQSIERLAERGGLEASEAIAVLNGKDYHEQWPNGKYPDNEELIRMLLRVVKERVELQPHPPVPVEPAAPPEGPPTPDLLPTRDAAEFALRAVADTLLTVLVELPNRYGDTHTIDRRIAIAAAQKMKGDAIRAVDAAIINHGPPPTPERAARGVCQQIMQMLGPHAIDCGCEGCHYEIASVLRLLREHGVDYQPRKSFSGAASQEPTDGR